MKSVLGWCAALLAAATLLLAAKPVGSTRPAPTNLWGNEKLGIGFDLPEGWRADSSDPKVTLVIPPGELQFSFAVQVEDGPYLFGEELSDPADTLVSYVKQRFTGTCSYVGSDVDRYPVDLRSIRHVRLRRSLDVVEFAVEVVEDPTGNFDPEAFTTDGDPAAGSEPDITPDSLAAERRKFVVGPSFLVNLSTAGRPRRVWVLPYCGDPTAKETTEAMRAVVRSLRRI